MGALAVYAFETPEPISAVIELVAGEAHIAAGARQDTVVEVGPTDSANQADVNAAAAVRVEFSAGTLSVRSSGRWRSWSPFGYGGSVTIRIGLPSGSRLAGGTSMGEFRCTGELGDCQLKTSLGDVHVEQAASARLTGGAGSVILERASGDVELNAASGEIRAGEIDGSAEVKNANGDTHITRITGELRVKSANGDVAVGHASGPLVVKTAYGDVRVDDASGSSAVAESGCGTVEIGVRDGVAAWLDLHTGYGRLENELEAAGAPKPGDPRIEVRARTGYGDITIRRSYLAEGEDR